MIPLEADYHADRTIPATGEELPVIGLGTWQTFDIGAAERKRAPLAEVLREFVALGGRLVDSSPMYGRSEEVVGAVETKAGVQEQLFLATKVWTSGRQKGIELAGLRLIAVMGSGQESSRIIRRPGRRISSPI